MSTAGRAGFSLSSPFFFLVTRRPPGSTLFPYTTLFRSTRRRTARCADGTQGGTHRAEGRHDPGLRRRRQPDRKSTRLNSSHANISYAVFCLKKKKTAPSVAPAPQPYSDPSAVLRLLPRL